LVQEDEINSSCKNVSVYTTATRFTQIKRIRAVIYFAVFEWGKVHLRTGHEGPDWGVEV